jgi:hypothetical protein
VRRACRAAATSGRQFAWYHYARVSRPSRRALEALGVRATVGGLYADSYTGQVDCGFFVLDHGGCIAFVCNN